MRKYKHSEWYNKYKDKIKVTVLGEYINIRTPIICKCICGNIKPMSPMNIQIGRLCKQDCHRNYYDILLPNKISKKFNIISNEPETFILECKKCYHTFQTKKKHKIKCNNCDIIENNEYNNFIEKYKDLFLINNQTKSKAKLTCKKCNHTFNTSKNKSIKCANCERYDKNIKIFDELKRNNIKILDNVSAYDFIYKKKYNLLCSCGYTTFNSVSRIIKTLNCKKCRTYNNKNPITAYTNKKTILYYVKFDNYYKIGITLYDRKNISPEEQIIWRFKRFKDKIPNEILKFKIFENGIEAYNLEQYILNKYKKYKLNDPSVGGGWTEFFKIDIFNVDFNESKYLNDKLMVDIANFTKGKSTVEDIQKKCQRDCYLSPEESVQYGLIDAIV